jgi:hypothetical protein
VSFTPFLDDVGKRLAHQYLLTFLAKPQKKAGWQRIRLMTEVPNTDLVGPRKGVGGGGDSQRVILSLVHVFVQRDFFVLSTLLSKLHNRLVHSDANQPG